MIKKLDLYILKKFFGTFFLSIFLFAVIAIVIDFSEKTDNFVKSKLSPSEIITQYYFGFVPHIIALLFPLFVFISVIFFTSKMANRTEIVPIYSSGISYFRWLLPYIVGGSFLAILLWMANQWIIPRANKIRGDFEATYVDRDNSYEQLVRNTNTSIYFKIDASTYAGIHHYDTLSKKGNEFFYSIKSPNGEIVYNLRAENILWDLEKKKWKLEKVVERNFLKLGETIHYIDEKYENFNFKPVDLSRDKYTKDKLSSPELARFISLEESRGAEGINDLKVELYRRHATSVTVLLLTIIGAIVSGKKVRGGSGAHLAFGFVMAAGFIIADRFSTIFSTKGNLTPMLAAWIPNIIFSFVVVYLYKKAPK